jgi:hypothetical protein
MLVREFIRQQPGGLCDACLSAVVAMTTEDELTLLNALCEECEGKVASAGRPPGAMRWEHGEIVDLETGEVIHQMKPRWIKRDR